MPPGDTGRVRRVQRVGVVTSESPRTGVATYAAELNGALVGLGDEIVAVNAPGGDGPWPTADAITGALAGVDAVIVHHALGADDAPGAADSGVLRALAGLGAPIVMVLHALPLEPTEAQRAHIGAACAAATCVVVATTAARGVLVDRYGVEPRQVVVVQHGAHAPSSPRREPPGGPPRLLTWGVIRSGTGVEHVIHALALLRERNPKVRYLVAGPDDPHVEPQAATRYRESLTREAWATGVAASVRLDATPRAPDVLAELVASASLVILADDPSDDVASAVLATTAAAGRPVIATATPHAVELLGDGAGLLVPHGDPVALAGAIESLLDDPSVMRSMADRARQIAPTLAWPVVAVQYHELIDLARREAPGAELAGSEPGQPAVTG